MPDFLKNITETSYFLLKNILEQPGCVPADFFFDDPTVDGHVELLKAYDLITMDENERQEELNSIKSIADSSKGQAETAKKQAEAAKKDAKFSRITSILAIIISIIAIIVQVVF